MATLVLWASCSDADKNADKSPEQENSEFEFPVDSKYLSLKIPFRPIQFEDSLFDTNGVSIKVFKDYSIESTLVYNDDVEKIAQILRKETKPIYEIFDSFYKKETCHELYGVSVSLKVSIGTNGSSISIDLVCRWGISLISALIILTHSGCNNSMVGASNSVCGCECDHINSVKTVIAEVFEKEQRYQLQC